MSSEAHQSPEQEPLLDRQTEAAEASQEPLNFETSTEAVEQLAHNNPDVPGLAAAETALHEAHTGEALPSYQALERAILAVEEVQTSRPDLAATLEPVWTGLQQERGRRLPEYTLAEAAAERSHIDVNVDQLGTRAPSEDEVTAGQVTNIAAIRKRIDALENESGPGLLPTNPGPEQSSDSPAVHVLAEVADSVNRDAVGMIGTQEVASEYSARMSAILRQRLDTAPEGARLSGTVEAMLGETNLREAQQRLATAGVLAERNQVAHMSFAEFARYAGITLPDDYTSKVDNPSNNSLTEADIASQTAA